MILNLFKKKEAEVKTANQWVEEIHETFYTEVDRLLEEAKVKKDTKTDKQDLVDKAQRLKKLGFSQSSPAVTGSKEIERINALRQENIQKESLIEAINYFTQNYPQYKFITEESVKKICQKYNLIYATIDRYIGDVPDKNLLEIENFKVKEEDEAWIEEYRNRFYSNPIKFISKARAKELEDREDKYVFARSGYTVYEKAPMQIAAPLKDFNTDGMEVKDFKLSKIEIPDPVVLQPVIYKNNQYFLIVSAWGIEASDELVINQKMN